MEEGRPEDVPRVLRREQPCSQQQSDQEPSGCGDLSRWWSVTDAR